MIEVPEKLPKGIYFERERQRFRVRLYLDQTVIWRTYHRRFEAAAHALEEAKLKRQIMKQLLKREAPKSLADLVGDLQ